MMNISAIAPFLPWKNPSTQGCELNVPTSVESLCFASWKHSGRIVFVEAFCWLGRLREGLTSASMILTFSTDLAASSFFFYFSSVFRKRSKEWKRQKNQKQEKIIIQTDYTNTTTLEFPIASRPSTLNRRLKGRLRFKDAKSRGLGQAKAIDKVCASKRRVTDS